MRITDFENVVLISTKNCCTGWGVAISVNDSDAVVREIEYAIHQLISEGQAEGQPEGRP